MAGQAPTHDDAHASLADLLDGERLAAERPSHRLFRAHPALGLDEMEDDMLSMPSTQELGARWFALEPEERQQREADLRRALLVRAARFERAAFEGGWPGARARTQALARRCGAVFTSNETARGALVPQAMETLLAELPDIVVVDGGPELIVLVQDSGRSLGVWVDRWKAGELERELQEAWWRRSQARAGEMGPPTEARRREAVDRELRAHVYVGAKRAMRLFPIALFTLLVAAVWGDGWLGQLESGAVALAVALMLDWLLERWYHRNRVSRG